MRFGSSPWQYHDVISPIFLLFHNKIQTNQLLYSYTPFISNDYIISFLLSLLSYLHYIQTSPERFSLNPLILSLIMYCPKSMYRHTSKTFSSSTLNSTLYQRFNTLITSGSGVSLNTITFCFHIDRRCISFILEIVHCWLSLLYTNLSPGCTGYFFSVGRVRLIFPSSRHTTISLFSG